MIRIGHGYFRGGIYPLPDISPTIDAHMDCWHILIGEKNDELLHTAKCNGEICKTTTKRNGKNSVSK